MIPIYLLLKMMNEGRMSGLKMNNMKKKPTNYTPDIFSKDYKAKEKQNPNNFFGFSDAQNEENFQRYMNGDANANAFHQSEGRPRRPFNAQAGGRNAGKQHYSTVNPIIINKGETYLHDTFNFEQMKWQAIFSINDLHISESFIKREDGGILKVKLFNTEWIFSVSEVLFAIDDVAIVSKIILKKSFAGYKQQVFDALINNAMIPYPYEVCTEGSGYIAATKALMKD